MNIGLKVALTLAFTSTQVGCGKNAPQTSSKAPQNIVFDIEGDPGFSASIEHPSAPAPEDNKFHYRISIRNLNSPASVEPTVSKTGLKLVQVNPAEEGTRPIGSKVKEIKPEPLKSWEEVHGKVEVEGATVVDFAREANQGSLWSKVQGACRLDGEVACWDTKGKPDYALTSKVSQWYSGNDSAFYKGKDFNRLIAISQSSSTSSSYSPGAIGFESESTQTAHVEGLIFFLAKVDPAIQEMPMHFSFYRPNGKSSDWFQVPEKGSVKVGKFVITRVESQMFPGASMRRLILDIKPRPQQHFYLSAKATPSGPEEMRIGYFGTEGYEIHQMGLEEIRWLKFDFNDTQSVLWKHIPLRPLR